MEKFKTVYKLILAAWKIFSENMTNDITEDWTQHIVDEFNREARQYNDAEVDLLSGIMDEVLKYLWRTKDGKAS